MENITDNAAGRRAGAAPGPTRRSLLLGSAAIAAAVAAGPRPAAAADPAPPHIVYILSDDQGYKDVGYRGSDIRTPVIDRLAAGGAVLEQFYVAPMCTPSRAALLTGRYPLRYGLQTGVIPSGGLYGLAMDEFLLPQALKGAGYRTAMVGKWHLGHAKQEMWPRQRGFDSYYGPLVGEIDHFKHTSHGVRDWYRDNQVVEEEGYDTTLFGTEAARIIAGHDPKTPLFLYVAFTAPHTPYQAPQSYLDRYAHIADPNRRAYAAQITAMDEEIGRIVAALDRSGMRDNTLVIYHTDNGGTRNAIFTGDSPVQGTIPPDNTPLRDGKGTLYEGGTRSSALMNWPGRIPAGKATGLTHITDMFPTLTRLARATTAQAKPLDGFDIWPHVTGQAPSPRSEIVHNIEPFRGAVRQGDWKLLVAALLPGRTELYDLAKDPGETQNLAAAHPEIVARLRARIDALAREAVPPLLLMEMVRMTFGAPPSTPEFEAALTD